MQKKMKLLTMMGLFLVPTVPILAAVQVPEVWGGTESLVYFTLALTAFAMMIRLKILKPRVKR